MVSLRLDLLTQDTPFQERTVREEGWRGRDKAKEGGSSREGGRRGGRLAGKKMSFGETKAGEGGKEVYRKKEGR